MNASNADSKPKVRKETKNKITVDFERTSFKERFKAKYLTLTFLKKVMWALIRYILLIGVAYVVLFPFFSYTNNNLPLRFLHRTEQLFYPKSHEPKD